MTLDEWMSLCAELDEAKQRQPTPLVAPGDRVNRRSYLRAESAIRRSYVTHGNRTFFPEQFDCITGSERDSLLVLLEMHDRDMVVVEFTLACDSRLPHVMQRVDVGKEPLDTVVHGSRCRSCSGTIVLFARANITNDWIRHIEDERRSLTNVA